MSQYRAAKTIGIYVSMPGGEIDTRMFIYDALDHGKKVFVPFIDKETNRIKNEKSTPLMMMVSLRSRNDFETLEPDKWGIPTPSRNSLTTRDHVLPEDHKTILGDVRNKTNQVRLDMIIMPGVAFDRACGRLGHGKGFYDEFLARLNRMCCSEIFSDQSTADASEPASGLGSPMPYLGDFPSQLSPYGVC